MTTRYPDNDKSEWVLEYIYAPYRRNGRVVLAANIYATQRSKDLGDDPFLKNNWEMQIRRRTPEGEHQRIQRDDLGRMLHASGEHVAPEDVEDFLLLPKTIQWQENEGLLLPPWMFPTYDGVLEGLDPQWLRERFSVSVQGQVDGNISRYLAGAFERKLSGDHRGTTLDLQVGAESDDAHEQETSSPNITTATLQAWNHTSVAANRFDVGFRWSDSSIAQGNTIDVCFITAFCNSSTNDDPGAAVDFEDVASSGTFTTDDGDVDGRTLTGNAVNWNGFNIGTGDVNSPSLVTPLQALVDAHTPTTYVGLLSARTNSAKRFNIRGYAGSSITAARVHIEFSAGGENPDARAFFPRVMVY